MVDKLQKLREPLAFVVVGAFALRLVLSLGAFAVYTASIGPVSAALSALDPISGGLLALTGTVIVGSCAVWGDPTPRARFLVLIAAVLFAVEVAVGVLIGIVGLFAGNPFGTLVQMLHLVLPALAAVVLYTIHQGLPAPADRQPVPGWPQQPAPQQTAPQQTGPRPSGPRPSGSQPQSSGPQHSGPQHPPPQPGLQHQPGPQQHAWSNQQPGPHHQPAPQQPDHQTGQQQPHPGQHDGPPPPAAPGPPPPAAPGPPPGSGAPQTGQAGAPEQIAPEPGRDVDTVDWQPAPQQPPQRLQPSPHHPAVGPHSRPDTPPADRTTTERPAEGATLENSAAQTPGSEQPTHRRGDERRG